MQSISEVKAFIDSSDKLRRHVRLHLVPLISDEPTEPPERADAIVEAFGYSPIGRFAWRSLPPVEAKELLANMLHRGMAYDQEMLPRKTAQHLAEVLVGSLDRFKSRFLANGSIAPGSGARWTPIGSSTFEMAVVGFDQSVGFLVYAEDED
jgi:hypothetical protein